MSGSQYCKVKECPWVVYASRDHEDTCWQIKTFNDDHTCPREDKNRAANRNWVCSKLVKKVRKYPNFRHCEATTYFRTRFDLTPNKNSISRALMDARSVVYGDEKEQYKMVMDYGLTLLKTNPGSTVQICTKPQPNGEVIFERMYVCLSGCKNGFKSGCRPLIGLDGAFLKTQFGGQILSAVGQDANHHIYVIAWAIVEIENRENWKWFLELLHLDLGHYKENGWCFISDMQKYVCYISAERFHQFASYLTEMLIGMDYYGEGEFMLGTVMVIDHDWQGLIHYVLLNDHDWQGLISAMYEVFNAKIKDARAKPIITLLEEVRMFVMRTTAKNKVKLNNHTGVLTSVIKSRLEKPQDDGDQRDGEDNHLVQSTEIGQATSDAQPVEIDISQPTASDVEDSQKDHGIKRPSTLSPRRRSSPLATSVPVNSMQGASSGTATRLVNYMKFIPTPGFKAPRKKN
ncbi:uncharacterized protein LOC107632514 [Arachis ipaensis]|uniref:uncharacterized protein LOC107632514 n=1 Tax=Arachis ipaensis TaxID=130454 RepID=UPI000A2B5886|nr:uncharacterized protein LOC107632514 [Arachis ipaensis]